MSERKDLLLRLPAEDHAALKNLAFFTDRSMNEIVCAALHEYLVTTGRREHLAAVVESGRSGMRDLLDKLGQ
jgi:hypothetical protein